MAIPEQHIVATSASQDAVRAVREHEFTHAASHELRTPLTVIRVASDLLAHDHGLSCSSRRSLERIQAAVGDMEAILDALLLLARAEDCALVYVDFPVHEVVQQELERVRPALQAKGLSLQWVEEATPSVHAPPRVLQVILGNLLANAVRFTDLGEVRVRVCADRVLVEDTGIGMDAQALAQAHAAFFCARAGVAGGPGLGLSVAHRLAVRCGWSIRLESTLGCGTRASIVFAPSVLA